MKLIDSGIPCLRDPFVVVDNEALYVYGTGWVVCRNTTGRLDSGWEKPISVVTLPEQNDAVRDHWAPEVHRYQGAYYMFTTYRSAKTNHRGCTIFRADTPEGAFLPYSDGHITPSDWDSIDGTLYIDPDGQPWIVFVHEWTCTDDHIGRFAAAKLSSDLRRRISEPIELFRADSSDWTKAKVTDGCFLYRTVKGSLLMLWSNFASDGYAVGIARSDNGEITGKWTHDRILYSKTLAGNRYDGGHCMVFDYNGQKYLSLHSPNAPVGERREMPVFIPIEEQNDTLICLN